MRLWSPSGVFLAVCIVLVMMDESAALPVPVAQEGLSDPVRGTERRLLFSQADMDVALSQAERLGSGEQTFDDLTAGVQHAQPPPEPWSMPNPEVTAPRVDALAAFNLEAHKKPAIVQNTQFSLFAPEPTAAEAPAIDPLANFEQQKLKMDRTSVETGQLEAASSAAAAESGREKDLLQGLGPLSQPAAAPMSHVAELGAGGLDDALAAFDREESAALEPALQPARPIAPAVSSFASMDPQDDDGGGDLGESDSMSDQEDDTATSMNSEINKEAAEAAQSVLKETMKTVENDFLSSEKALTKGSQNSPELTLDALRKPSATAARAAKNRKDARSSAKDEHKKMKLEAKLAYDKAIAASHTVAKEQLDHVLGGLRMEFSVKKKSVEEEAVIKTQQAKQKMLDQIRTADIVAVNRLQATLPIKLAKVRQKAQAEAEHAASMAIDQITQENTHIRQSLQTQLGEANNNLNAARMKLSGSDADPQLALQNAVAVKTEKDHVHRLGELATVAMSQQKSHSATEVAKAQEDAKESVRLAMKHAQKKELGEARTKMSAQQAKIRAEAEGAFKVEEEAIKKETHSKVLALQKNTKELVDTAIQRAPLHEQELHHKATGAYKQAIAAADNFLEEKLEKDTADVTVTDGSTINRDIAESAVENPTESKAFTLENQNFEAAAKFAASEARQAKRKVELTKKKTSALMKELTEETKAAKTASEKAEALDEKVTRIKLAKLQLHEAQAATAFNKAARAHLQEELAKKQMATAQKDPKNKDLSEFEKKLKDLQTQARSTTVEAFKEAKASASALTKGP